MPLPDQNLEMAAYHTQQAAEKGVKALLTHLGIAYARGQHGHDIALAAAGIPASHRLAKAQALGLVLLRVAPFLAFVLPE
ncbi:HEPN domain-containing protein [Microvirga aerophila]|uniref:HEPN domain-containing protein n=1 Tax=Microvirga aerophila TaxID=670291 RepID=A0A512BV46_9HYPH|nr:HEPN domain-containing protein [Microvirga aerophila]GEO15785.1 hypothetical protein MAE02_34810 [Microvirga aerophila]